MYADQFLSYLKQNKELIDKELPIFIEQLSAPQVLKDSMIYSLRAGGKRIRPVLLLATLEAFQKDRMLGIEVACALEMIHTYSLIHDDLPSMDNDDLRRGKPTNHKVYGEAIAILAGDALLTHSFSVISMIKKQEITPEMKLDLISRLSLASGASGMVGGQTADLLAEDKDIQLNELEYIHEHKTGKLLIYPVIAGGILANASKEQLDHLEQFAKHLGLAFQIKDDILDIEGDEKQLGKPVGSDTENQKSTYPQLLSLSGAREKCQHHLQLAKNSLYKTDINYEILEKLADFIVNRDH